MLNITNFICIDNMKLFFYQVVTKISMYKDLISSSTGLNNSDYNSSQREEQSVRIYYKGLYKECKNNVWVMCIYTHTDTHILEQLQITCTDKSSVTIHLVY